MAKSSRQAMRTRRLLQEALVELIEEQGYEPLRVQDITDRADVGRATFYCIDGFKFLREMLIRE